MISVIIPNYNQARYLTGAIQSVLQQTYRSFEIIVVDDGSTDDSLDAIASLGSQIRYIWQENQGLAGARNTGIRAATGEFIGLLDADDLWQPNYLEEMVRLAKQHPEAAVYYCCAQGMDSEGHDLPQIFGGPVVPQEKIYDTLLRANFLIPSTIMMRRSVVIQAGLFDQSLRSCEDWDLWLRLLPEHVFIGTSTYMVRYRIHGGSLSTNPIGMQQAARTVIEKNFGIDDGQPHNWSLKKRRAYGGVYRYCLLTSVQRQNDWLSGANYLLQALRVDPTLSSDLSLFYDLALGNQPPGYRDSNYLLNLETNAYQINNMLVRVFQKADATIASLRRQVYGTTFFALGLVAYNTGRRSLSRKFLLNSIRYRPDLLREPLVISNLIKSMFSPKTLERIKNYGFQTRN